MKSISIIGPESSGKTTLALLLSKILKGKYVDEYAREYLNKKTKYSILDLDKIALNQNKKIKIGFKSKNKFLISDTSTIVIEIWSILKYKKVSDLIKTKSNDEKFDYYLLCKPDIPWYYDSLRENPNDRKKIFDYYENLLNKRKINFQIIDGKLHNRINISLDFILNN